jgi:hypothetical protein
MIVREAKRFVSLIREVGRGLVPEMAQDQVAIAA